MNNANFKGYDFENSIKQLLEQFGWENKLIMDQPQKDMGIYPDFALLDENGKIYGIVEAIYINPLLPKNNIRNKLELKIKEIEFYFKNDSIKFVIVTNGNAFDLYIGGKLINSDSTPPTPQEIQILLREGL